MSRSQRISDLKKAADDYCNSEKKRIENEVSVLNAVLSGRTGGKGIQQAGTSQVQAVAVNDLASFLKGD